MLRLRLVRAIAVVLLVVVAAACSDDDDTTGDDAAPDEPTEVAIDATIEPNPVSAISAILNVTTTPDAAVHVTVTGPEGQFDIPESESGPTHKIPVVGMRAETDYTIAVSAGESEDTIPYTTGSLPADLPPVTLEMADAAKMSPGVTVFNAFPWAPVPDGAAPPDVGWVIAVDDEGEVVWYEHLQHQILDVDTTPRGTFIVTAGDLMVQEFDLFGTVDREWGSRIALDSLGKDVQGRVFGDDKTFPIDIDSSHHEITELDNGNFVTLSTEVIEMDPDDVTRLCPDTPEGTIVGDIAVELSPDGEVVQQWPLSAVLDPATAPGNELCNQQQAVAPPNWFYPSAGLTRDWTHANAIDVHEDTNTILISLRHLDLTVALRYHDDDEGKAGDLLWSLGANGTLELDGELPSHQHAIELHDDGELWMYDNGNRRPNTIPGGGTEPPYSRAVAYQLDLDAGTATQVYEHKDTWADGRTVFTPFLGDVDILDNDDVLIDHGGGSTAEGSFQAKIVEVVRGDDPHGADDETVFSLLIGDGQGPGWSSYRAMRLPSLYFGANAG
jgi:hypothetical protein